MTALPAFLTLADRRVLLVGGGRIAAASLQELLQARARVRVVAPRVHPDIENAGVTVIRHPFEESDLEGCWFAVAAATPEVNEKVAAAAEYRRIFVNAVSDPAHESARLSGVPRNRGPVLPASTGARSAGLGALLRQALQVLLPHELGDWVAGAECLRGLWREHRVPMEERRPLVLQALEEMYR